MIKQFCSHIKILFLTIIGVIRRGLCCFSRRRKPSLSESEPLEVVCVGSNRTSHRNGQGERDWNSWDDSPRTVEEHIEQYRQKLVRPPTPQEVIPEPDFFQDMVPKIKPQPKIYINTKQEQKTDFSRLEAQTDVPIPMADGLEDWVEEEHNGWEELDEKTTKKLIREKRKELRAQKQIHAKQKDGSNRIQQNFAERIVPR